MKIVSRGYHSVDDLYAIGKLVRRAWAQQPGLNAWSFCRFDIWAQRRISDADALGETRWQKELRLWLDESGEAVGASFAPEPAGPRGQPGRRVLVLHPAHTCLAEAMLDELETGGEVEVEVFQSNHWLGDLLQSRGYRPATDCMIARQKTLGDSLAEAVELPPGYRIGVLRPAEVPRYFVAVNAVFNRMDTAAAFRSILRAPSSVPELHLNVLSPDDDIAAFCSVWLDRENNVAEFEPVGTTPRFQRKGLAQALLAHACNRLREMGCPLVRVEAWSKSEAANRLYALSGLEEVDRMFVWKRG